MTATIDRFEECVLVAALEWWPIEAPVEEAIRRGEELAQLSDAEFDAHKCAIISTKIGSLKQGCAAAG
jgi:hypothetical protein